MSTEEIVFTAVIFILALAYIYKSLFKSKGCGSCGCGDSKDDKDSKNSCKEE